jgi:hypothetical protein
MQLSAAEANAEVEKEKRLAMLAKKKDWGGESRQPREACLR